MEVPTRKVTAKLSSQNINGPATNPSPSPQLIVRAKVSSTARPRTGSYGRTSNTTNESANPNSNVNGALRPHVVGVTARRSPSPAKMRPVSPSKLQPQLRPATVRAPLSKAATMKPAADRARHGSISSMLSLTPGGTSSSPASAPTTPLTRTDTNSVLNGDAITGDSGSNSFRIKSKVSGLAKPAPPSLSTILSPPSPSSPSFSPSFPSANHPPRARATTVASRRPSVSFFVSESQHDPLQPSLPTSPPTSNLSFSSHSSASASASASASTSSTHSHSTSTGLTPPTSYTNHARSESLPLSMVNLQSDDPFPSRPASPPPKRTLVARVRPGTRISGGRGRGWTSGSSVAGERELRSSDSAQAAGMDDRSTDDSEHGDSETRKRRTLCGTGEDNPEDDVRAEAKSNRKIADLEITTRSLLTINASLESSKLRQAREIRELRRKLRETRLAMPPGKYRLLTEQERNEDNDQDAEEDEDEDEKGDQDADDEDFRRVKTLMEDLLAAGRRALAVPAPPSLLSTHHGDNGNSRGGESSPSSATARKLDLGIESGPTVGTRMDQGEVLGWDIGSSLGAETGIESGSRRWKHGVAIGSKVLSPEEARPWVGEEGEKDQEDEEGAGEGRDEMGLGRVGTLVADDPLSDSFEPNKELP